MISKLVLLLIIIGVLVFLYRRKNEQKDVETTSSDVDSTPQQDENDAISSVVVEVKAVIEESATQETVVDSLPEEYNEVEDAQETPLENTEPVTQESAVAEDVPSVQLDWANANLSNALKQHLASENASEGYSALVAAISECYKQRKSQQYLIYGYSLTASFVSSFTQYLSYRTDQGIETELKGTAFMQLATLAQDNGNFDHAIEICNTALANELSDGTVTGFEGRIKRIEKAKIKANS